MSSPILLAPAEARVLAALVEKSLTTPQYYPMTVNAITLAANQKSARHPVMNLSEGEVGAALNRLSEHRFVVRDDLSGRVVKWRHQFQHQLLLKSGELAVLATLMLRGPQTVAELRANAAGLDGPADAEGVIAVLASLADRAQPLVTALPRAIGQSAARHTHLLCGEPAIEPHPEPTRSTRSSADEHGAPALAERVRALEARVAELERKLA